MQFKIPNLSFKINAEFKRPMTEVHGAVTHALQPADETNPCQRRSNKWKTADIMPTFDQVYLYSQFSPVIWGIY